MLSSTLTFMAVVLSFMISQVTAADPSAVPYNGYTCPTLDKGNFPVGVTNYASDPIFCAYPLTAGSSDTTFNCQYDPTTGTLVTDNDDGGCPSTAVAPVQRRGTKIARAPLPSRPLVNRGIPAGSAEKAYMKKRRHQPVIHN
ncbi:hypothetical protein HYPSUDRAFT_205637 [Hypholoma sublateritium FD-334 SS-4]|uniref:Uncharacterized protein n=1 Tax=Hypholoma sublateritium (strain FD-334 SS-4) TaxID=945553 RepID=A0A0D2NN08_HYPSF|nr:hypothetical protein HYPSUDRAFT_205637 [Hypholoma sublateritium FD-334 SS-4]